MNSSDIKALIQKFGPPAYENANRVLSRLNENFWAAYYAKQREKIIFEALEQEFYDYDSSSGLFSPKSSDAIRVELSALMLKGSLDWPGFKALEQFRSAKNLNGAITFLRGQIEERDFFNQEHHYVHLGNCTLKFEPDGSKYSVEPFSHLHRSRNRSPIFFDPKASCPEFEAKILGHLPIDDRILLQKYAGQCLLGRNLTQRFAILDGIAGASKGAFVLILNGIVGPKSAYELRTNLLTERFEIGRMIGRTLLIGADVKGNFLSNKSAYRIKSLVGGDPLEAEIKGSNQRFTIYGCLNLVITSNARLRVFLSGDQSAWERRILIVRYEVPFTGKKIFEIEKYLLAREDSGILNWCIDGLSLLFQDYAKAGDIVLTPDQQKRVTDLLNESDSLRLFVSTQIVRDDSLMSNGESHSLTVEEIVGEYTHDCIEDKQWTPLTTSDAEKQLPDLMLQHFGTPKAHDIPRNGKGKRGFRKVRFV
jgi:phage/plasmid-associated DNA primase